MCLILDIPKSTYYYHINLNKTRVKCIKDGTISREIFNIFKFSRNNFGTRKIKKELAKLPQPIVASRRKIGRLMNEMGLVSNYTVAQYKLHKTTCNEAPIRNELQREFNQNTPLAVVVSDLTYVRVKNKWHYVCLFVDLFNREIIGHSVGENKTANLVYQALASVKANLHEIGMFHTDRGKEFDNQLISNALETFGIQRSLSQKGCPYDNAVAEATFKVFKTEFSNTKQFESLDQLSLELDDYVHWYNNFRIHGTLGYLTPTEYKNIPYKNCPISC